MSITFFKTVQNKVHYAITGHTAAEIVASRADSSKVNMGLTNFRGAVPRKDDVSIAKNYLDESELSALNNLVEQYLIFAEGQAMRRIPMMMRDWIEKLHGFLILNDRDILSDAGKVSHEMAMEKSEREYEKFNTTRINMADHDSIDDFDKVVGEIDVKKKLFSTSKIIQISLFSLLFFLSAAFLADSASWWI